MSGSKFPSLPFFCCYRTKEEVGATKRGSLRISEFNAPDCLWDLTFDYSDRHARCTGCCPKKGKVTPFQSHYYDDLNRVFKKGKRRESPHKSLIPKSSLNQRLFVFLLFILAPNPFSESDHPSEIARVEGKRKRPQHRIRTTIGFDPTPKALHSQKEVEAYPTKYGIRLPSNVKVEWCPLNTELANAPEGGGVYLYPQVLALGLTFPVTSFMCYYHVTLSQLVAGD